MSGIFQKHRGPCCTLPCESEPLVERSVRPRRRGCLICVLALTALILLQAGCGPEDYRKPIRQFQDASTVVISATRVFLNNMNAIEQDEALDDAVFQREPLDLPGLNKIQIISPAEIKIRTDALDALAQYTSNLAQLAQGKPGSAVGDSTTKLSASLKTLADDAGKLPATKATFLNNARLSGMVSGAASAVGAVAQLIVEHKARREIERSIVSTDAAIEKLIQQIGDDAQGAYLRQQAQMGDYGNELSKDYEKELKRNADPILLLSLARTIQAYRTQESQLSQANPAPAIDKMKKAHEALVSCIKSGKNPETFAELVAAVQDFVAAVKPLGQAVQALFSAANARTGGAS